MFLIIVLSGFNGLDELVKDIFRTFDPEIKITSKKGKSFVLDNKLKQKIQSIEGVDIISEIIEDDGVLKYQDQSVVVKFKGVDSNYFKQNNISKSIVKGISDIYQDEVNLALIGQGIEYRLSVPLNNQFTPMVLWYVRNSSNPRKATFPSSIKVGGVFAIEKQFDDQYIFVPLEMAKNLTEYTNERTALELNVKPNHAIDDVKNKIISQIGNDFNVLNSDEQHASLYKAHQIEKLITFIIMVLLLLVGSLTIFFTLSMQVIEKQNDIAILFSVGFSKNEVRQIFLINGFLISLTGTVLGLGAAFILIFLQQKYGLVPMGMETAIVASFPVKMQFSDFVLSAIAINLVSIVISMYPAKKAANVKIAEFI